jgi:DNA-binding HxlR family transcriptional regulator
MITGRANIFSNSDIFFLGRNERKPLLRDIVIEAMRELNTNPLTKPELQKLVRIRKKTFTRLLRSMIESGIIERIGGGVKADPWKYQLSDRA